MKKKILMLLAVVLLISAFCMTGAAAAVAEADTTTTATNSLGSNALTVKYNGAAITFPDAQPYVDSNNRTLIPVRFVAETMGADVSWNQEAQTAIIEQNGITIKVQIGSDMITVTENDSISTIKMDTAAVINEERTYVPIRFVAESLGAWVGYSDLFSTVQIYKDVLSQADITRLHSYYDMTWEEYCKAVGYTSVYTDAGWLKGNPQIAYFTGTYSFENANEWKLRNPNGIEFLTQGTRPPINYIGKVSGLKYTYGTQPDIDFANLILAEARDVQQEINTQGKVTIAMKADLSCVYFSRHSNSADTYVRGVLTVTIPANADIPWIKSNYDFIPNPVPGSTRTIDVEIDVNTYTNDVHWSSITALS